MALKSSGTTYKCRVYCWPCPLTMPILHMHDCACFVLMHMQLASNMYMYMQLKIINSTIICPSCINQYVIMQLHVQGAKHVEYVHLD